MQLLPKSLLQGAARLKSKQIVYYFLYRKREYPGNLTDITVPFRRVHHQMDVSKDGMNLNVTIAITLG